MELPQKCELLPYNQFYLVIRKKSKCLHKKETFWFGQLAMRMPFYLQGQWEKKASSLESYFVDKTKSLSSFTECEVVEAEKSFIATTLYLIHYTIFCKKRLSLIYGSKYCDKYLEIVHVIQFSMYHSDLAASIIYQSNIHSFESKQINWHVPINILPW